METNTSITSLIVTLHEAGYSVDEILKELKHKPGLKVVSRRTVTAAIEKAAGKSADSHMLQSVYEMNIEMLALVRELVGERRQLKAEATARKLERLALATGSFRSGTGSESAKRSTNPSKANS
jgi:hypothetical protein